MAFPQVAATNSWFEWTNTTSHTVNLPSWISTWDLLLVLFTNDWSGLPTFPAWRNLIYEEVRSSVIVWAVYYRVADWTEGATITVTTAGSENSAHYTMRITWYNSTVSVNTTWIAFSKTSIASSTTLDPPSLSPARWAADNLWIVVAHPGNLWTSGSSVPTNYTANWWYIRSQATASTSWAYVWYWRRELNASSEDPWVFTPNAWAIPWIMATIAIQPWADMSQSNFFFR